MVAHDESLFLLFSSCIFWFCSSLILYRISFHSSMSWASVHLLAVRTLQKRGKRSVVQALKEFDSSTLADDIVTTRHGWQAVFLGRWVDLIQGHLDVLHHRRVQLSPAEARIRP